MARVLIAEDESVVALELSGALAGAHHEVVGIVATADDAVARTRELRPDLVLMDVRLAGEVDGIAAAGAIASLGDAAVVFVTAFGDEQTLARARLTRPYGYLVKPVDAAALNATLMVALDRRRAEQRARDGETVIRELYAIALAHDRGLSRQMELLVDLGRRRFGVPIGVIARVDGGVYTPVQVGAPAGFELAVGAGIPLERTSCARVVGATVPVDFATGAHAEGVAGLGPAALESFLGVSVIVRQRVWGVLCFASPSPRPQGFTYPDRECIQLMAQWLGGEVARADAEAEAQEANRRLERLSRTDPLTEVLNLRGLEELFPRIIERVRGSRQVLTLLTIQFAALHQLQRERGIGDANDLVKSMTDRVRLTVRPVDVVGRMSDDTIIALVTAADVDAGMRIFERVRKSCEREEHRPMSGSRSGAVQVSVRIVDPSTASLAAALAAAPRA